ncbi:MAG: metal ABC transporter permease [Candidatus Yanofskybacteria bacterium]|nr:metal ABC transporter permease [Candidatus Yanofskybacteria bacterium]
MVNELQLISAIFVGIASGYLGSFMVLKRMALVGDALSHVALPGIALALLFNINPFLGAFATLFAGIIGIWLIEHKTELPAESVVGLFFTFSLAVGLLITPEEELLEALFGDIATISGTDALLAIIFSLTVLFIMKSISKGFILGTISKDLAKASGIKVARDNFIFMILVALIVALGIKSVGTLLMGALVIIPAIASKNITSNMYSYTKTSAAIGLVSLVGGIILATRFGLPPGPIAVLTSTAIFLATLAFKK